MSKQMQIQADIMLESSVVADEEKVVSCSLERAGYQMILEISCTS